MTGRIRQPMRCIFFIPNSFVIIPRAVAVIKINSPMKPERIIERIKRIEITRMLNF